MRDLLKLLHDAEAYVRKVILEPKRWSSLHITYEKPHVLRLWTPSEDLTHRIYLHRILQCLPEEAFLHPHPWRSAVKVLGRGYEMQIARSKERDVVPDRPTRMFLPAGATYVMDHPYDWHSVCPTDEYSDSLMVTGPPSEWAFIASPLEKKAPPQPQLDPVIKDALVVDFFEKYFKS